LRIPVVFDSGMCSSQLLINNQDLIGGKFFEFCFVTGILLHSVVIFYLMYRLGLVIIRHFFIVNFTTTIITATSTNVYIVNR